MGYSCTADADLTMREIMEASGDNSSNSWTHENGFRYFSQIGRENADGAITGSVLKILKNGDCKRSGGFRIDSYGSVIRFPGLNKAMRAVKRRMPSNLEF